MEIQEIKAQLTLSQVLNYYHLKPDKNLRLNCPFHKDKTPSMQVYYKTHTAYCFSSNCKTHGKSLDVIDFIMYKENCTKHEAILKAKEMLGGAKSRPTASGIKIELTPKIPINQLSKTAILTKIFTYFKNGVHNSKPAKEYLKKRNLDYTKTEVGYNSGQFHHGKRKDEALIKSCIKYGLLLDLDTKSRTGNPAYKPFGKWGIVFPLKNKGGQITGLYFRSILADKKQRHFYLKERQGLYPCYPSAETKRLILTESIIDAATLLEQEPIKNKYGVLALFGTNGLTEEHQKAIAKLKELEEIIFFLNGDQPGIKAVEKYTPMLKGMFEDIKITSVSVPENEDVNSLLQGHSPEILIHLIDTRKEYTFLFSNEKEKVKTQCIASPSKPPKGLDTTNPHNLKYSSTIASYQIKGFRISQPDSLKITLNIANKGVKSYASITLKLDLYEYNQVEKTCKIAAEKLSLDKEQIEEDLQELMKLLEFHRDKQLYKKKESKRIEVPTATVSKCIKFLKSQNLIKRINNLIGKAGIVGEEINRILLFIIASSYKMPDTLHALIQGSSGSGKTRLLKIISELMPDEDVKRYTRVTDNSFYNQDEYFFVHKLICFEDLDGLKEDAQLAVRELQSNEILRTSTSLKDKNGSITGGERVVRGPIASMACTTRGETYEDNVSRSFLIAVDESKEQTLKVIEYQNNEAAGLITKSEQKKIKNFMQNCMRLLRPYEVINPYANKIKLPHEAHKIRRLNELYQSFVRQITLLNQYQRKQDRQGRLITDKEDLQTACDILFESIVLKVDELDGSLRQFFEKLKTFVLKRGKEHSFNRFEVREELGLSKSQQHYYINKLVELEYLQQSGFANRGYRYKIAHWDNIAAIRAKIKDNLQNQLNAL